jgi:predicted RNase H-like nuclease (RuvC/YqgF family)
VAASAAQAERSAGELATLQQRNEAALREIEQLTAALDQAQAERMEAIAASREAGAKAAELEAAFVASTQESRRLAGELGERRAPGGPGSAPGSADTENLRAEITGLRAELERVNREAQALRRTASEARQALSTLQGDASGEALLQARPAASETPPWQLAVTAAPSADEIRRLQQDLVDARATVAGLSADLEALKGTGTGPAPDAAVELATLEEQLGSAHRRAEQLVVSLAARQPDAAGAAPPAASPDLAADPLADAPADAAPLPSPPAPR